MLLSRSEAEKRYGMSIYQGGAVPGKTIRIKNSPYVVLGVLAPKGQSLDGRDQDDTVLVPVTTAQRKLFGTQFAGMVRFISVQAASAEAMSALEKAIIELLRQRHRIDRDKEDDFIVRTQQEIAEGPCFGIGGMLPLPVRNDRRRALERHAPVLVGAAEPGERARECEQRRQHEQGEAAGHRRADDAVRLRGPDEQRPPLQPAQPPCLLSHRCVYAGSLRPSSCP